MAGSPTRAHARTGNARGVDRRRSGRDNRPFLEAGPRLARSDALGTPARFALLPGQRHDGIGVAPPITDIDFGALIADKAFDVDWIRAELDQRGATAVIPPKDDRARRIACDPAMYRRRRLAENVFCALEEPRRIATRYDKTDTSHAGAVYLPGAFLALK